MCEEVLIFWPWSSFYLASNGLGEGRKDAVKLNRIAAIGYFQQGKAVPRYDTSTAPSG